MIPIRAGLLVNNNVPLDSKTHVADLTARNALSEQVRYIGMPVYVVSEDATFRLKGGVTNEHWVDESPVVPVDYSVVEDIEARDYIPEAARFVGMEVYVVGVQKPFRLVGGITNDDWVDIYAALTALLNDINIVPVAVNVAAGTPDTVTLDCLSGYQRIFSTDSIGDDVTLLLSNNTNIRVISYHFRVTGEVIMTFGGELNWVSDDTDWDDTGKTYTFTGTTDSLFEISIMRIVHDSASYYKIKFSGEQI